MDNTLEREDANDENKTGRWNTPTGLTEIYRVIRKYHAQLYATKLYKCYMCVPPKSVGRHLIPNVMVSGDGGRLGHETLINGISVLKKETQRTPLLKHVGTLLEESCL